MIAVVGCAALAVIIALEAGSGTAVLTWAAALGVALLTAATLRGRTIVGMIMIYGYLAFGVGAVLLYHPRASDYYGVNPGIADLAGATPGYQYLEIFTVVAFSLWLGFFVVTVAGGRRAATRGRLQGLGLSAVPAITLPSVALLIALVPLLLDAYGTGFHSVLHASTYLERTGPLVAFKIGRSLGAIGLFLAGYVFFAHRSLRTRIPAALIALGYAALYLGTATRFFGLVVPMFCFGGLLTGKWTTRRRNLALVISGISALLMIQIPIALRLKPDHGLVPSVHYIVSDPGLLFADPIDNVLFGAPLTLYVAHDTPPVAPHVLVTSLSPLPSSMTDWAQIAPTLKLNTYTPYSALGILLGVSWFCLAAVMAGFGVLYGVMERVMRRSAFPAIGLLVLSSVAALAVLRSTEYDVRTFARLAYYAAVVVLVLALVPVYQRRTRTRAGMPE